MGDFIVDLIKVRPPVNLYYTLFLHGPSVPFKRALQ